MPVTWLFDLRDALRSLVRSPLPSIAAIVIIAFGIGVNATVYSIADGFVRRPAPGVPPERRLILLEHRTKGQADPATSYPNYLDYAAQATTLPQLTARPRPFAARWSRRRIPGCRACHSQRDGHSRTTRASGAHRGSWPSSATGCGASSSIASTISAAVSSA